MKKPQEFSAFTDQIQTSVQSTVDNVLGSAHYDTNEVPNWVDTITAGEVVIGIVSIITSTVLVFHCV